MLGLVILFTIFVGLIGLLAAAGEYQKRHKNSVEKKKETATSQALEKVQRWLSGHGLEIPSAHQVTALLNSSLQQAESKEWREFKLEGVSIDEDGSLPPLTITSIKAEDNNRIQFECKLGGLPHVGVACVSETGERVTCSVQVEWLYVMSEVTLRNNSQEDGTRLLVSLRHTEPVKMSLSCATQGDIEDGERISSSVADDLQVWFTSLTFNDVPLPTPVPSFIFSNGDHQEGKGVESAIATETTSTLADVEILDKTTKLPLFVINGNNDTGTSSEATGEGEVEGQLSEAQSVSKDPTSLLNNTQNCDQAVSLQQEKGRGLIQMNQEWERDRVMMNGDSDIVGRENNSSGHPGKEDREKVHEGVRPSMLPSVREEGEAERDGYREEEGTPLSPSWRRSPSYEQLQQIELDPHRLIKSGSGAGSSLRASPPQRALTLSVSGSEAESIYGADERIPSTLVFEVADTPSKVRHIVAVTPVHAGKLRRRYPHAKKLHIYNDHCFTAMHIKKRVECVVCGSKISGLFGKQAYICQDCSIVVHKHCHFKVEGQCSGTQLQNMNLIYPDNTSTSSAN